MGRSKAMKEGPAHPHEYQELGFGKDTSHITANWLGSHVAWLHCICLKRAKICVTVSSLCVLVNMCVCDELCGLQ